MSLIKQWVCDGCRVSDNELPKEWITFKEAKDAFHLCSLGCLVKFLSEKKNIDIKANDGKLNEDLA